MTTSKQSGGEDGGVLVGAGLVEELAHAVRALATAFAADEAGEAYLFKALADARRSQPAASPEQIRTSRDYDVLRGLLGRVDAAKVVAARRERDAIVIESAIPASAVEVVIQSASGVVERVPLFLGGQEVSVGITGPPYRLPLGRIGPHDPVVRLELLDRGGALVALGPYLPALD